MFIKTLTLNNFLRLLLICTDIPASWYCIMAIPWASNYCPTHNLKTTLQTQLLLSVPLALWPQVTLAYTHDHRFKPRINYEMRRHLFLYMIQRCHYMCYQCAYFSPVPWPSIRATDHKPCTSAPVRLCIAWNILVKYCLQNEKEGYDAW